MKFSGILFYMNTNIKEDFESVLVYFYQDTDFAGEIDPVVGDDPITFILEKYKTIKVT